MAKRKIEYSPQVKEFLDDLLDKKDFSTLSEIMGIMDKIAEDPYSATRIIQNYEEDFMKELSRYKGRRIMGVGVWADYGESVFGNGRDIELELTDKCIELYSVHIFCDQDKIELKDVPIEKGVDIHDFEYRDGYWLNLKSGEREFLMWAQGIALGELPKDDFRSKKE